MTRATRWRAWIATRWRAWARALGWTLAAAYLLGAVFVLGVKYWLLPDAGRYTAAIEQAVSQALGERVTIGRIGARWSGLHAELDLGDVRIVDRSGRDAVRLAEVRAVIGWRSIPLRSLRLHSLSLEAPQLQLQRDASGRVFVAGLQLTGDSGSPGAAAWLLAQPEIVVKDARIEWHDGQRGARPLALRGLDLVLQNRGDRHRFSLRARPAPELASAIELRGELETNARGGISAWEGRLFASLEDTDLAAWRQWLDYPVELDTGRGTLRLWATLERGAISQATADLALEQVKVRVPGGLPPLRIERLGGRVSGERIQRDWRFSAKHLSFKLAQAPAFPAADMELHWQAGQADAPARAEARASVLELEPVAKLLESVPVAEALRERLLAMEPRGRLHDFRLSWTGELSRPKRYAVRARFTDLAVRQITHRVRLAGAAGLLEADEARGKLRLDSAMLALETPGVLPSGARFDTFTGEIGWKLGRDRWDVRLSRVAFSGSDVAGTVQGSFSARPGQGGDALDATASFSRLDARAVHRYLPYLPENVGDYLRASIRAGELSDARLRLKGNPRDFPFTAPGSGTFEASARITGGEFRFSERWPGLSGIAGELRFDRSRFQIVASRAAILGARVIQVRAEIPDFTSGDEALRLEGEAEGPVSEFLRFIDASPLAAVAGGATARMRATGGGRLQLALDVPIRRPAQTTATGNFQFGGGELAFDPALPPLSQLNGRLEFTESRIAGANLSAQFAGGPGTFSVATRPGAGMNVSAHGTVDLAAVRKWAGAPLLERASGTTAWKATALVGSGSIEWLIESALAGVTIALPEPFAKRADEALALRIERTNRPDAEMLKRAGGIALPAGGDAISVVAGKLVNAVFVRRRAGEDYVLQRAGVGINEAAPVLDEAGIVVAASLGYVDADRWRGLLAGGQGARAVAGVRLRANVLDVAGRRFHRVNVRASPATEGWKMVAASRELEGSITWQAEGRGRISARLKRFTVPDPAPGVRTADTAAGQLPSLDIVADQFVLGDKQMGRLEALAANQGNDWRIEKLLLAAADATLSASGIWQSWASRPSTALRFRLDVGDAAGFLARIGFPGTLKGGTALLEGRAEWAGGPQSIDYATLAGEVQLSATKGQFLRAEPGIAKLLGILSLQSWITLDFRDVFAEGFAFESIASTARISRGMLRTEDFTMIGKSALVTMSGAVDLARETQDLKVRLVPSVGDSASTVAGLLLANPVTALGAMVAQRLLRDPLGRMFAVDYQVTGGWSEPKVERVRSQTDQPGSPNP